MIAIWLQNRSATQRLVGLVHQCSLIRQGELYRTIQVSGTDEIAQLGSAIDSMVATIRDKIELLDQTRLRLQEILDNTPNGVILLDREFSVLIANNASVRMLAIPSEIVGRRSFLETIRNWDVWVAVEEAARTGSKVARQVELQRPSGTWLDVSVIPLARGEQGYLVIMNDISQLKRLERIRADFVANVSHELKTPLTSIQGFAETLLASENLDTTTAREFLQIIHDEAQRLTRIVESLLELSKLESGAVKPKIQEVDLRSLVCGVARLMEESAKAAGLKLEVTVSGEIGSIFSDPDMIRDSLLELLQNAIKYTPPGGTVFVQVEAGCNGASVEAKLSVEDTGVGIPEDELPRVFERFYRVDWARDRRSGGTGLGLSIVKHKMELLGGHVEAVSAVGRGSRFTLIVPSLVPKETQS
ncbi:MAG: sensor histidine kinase [Bacillota bacterium]